MNQLSADLPNPVPTLLAASRCLRVLAAALALGACTSGHGADADAAAAGSGDSGAGAAGGSAGSAAEPSAGDGGLGTDASVEQPFDGMPECVDGQLLLAPSFHLLREVDYVADRFGADVLSEVGTPCESARDRDLCEQSIEASTLTGFRHLLTTEGDKVLQWDSSSAINLLGAIDTLGEALWFAEAFDYKVDCDTSITFAEDLYIVRNAYAHWGCLEPQAVVTIVITPEGGVNEVKTQGLNINACTPQEFPGGMGGFLPPGEPAF